MGDLELPDGVRLVILDRDRTLIEGPASESEYLTDPEAVRLIEPVAELVARCNVARIAVAVATNQRCVARGIATMADVERVNARIAVLLSEHGAHIDRWYVCPHDIGECQCRKPLPGLLLQAMRDADAGPDETVMIGDRESDRDAARACGVSFEWAPRRSR